MWDRNDTIVLIVAILCFTGLIGHCQVLEMKAMETRLMIEHCEKAPIIHRPSCPLSEEIQEN